MIIESLIPTYGGLLHSDFYQDEMEGRKKRGLLICIFYLYILSFIFGLFFFMGILFDPNPLYIIVLFLVFVVGLIKGIRQWIKIKKGSRTQVLLFEKTILMLDRSTGEELGRYDIEDLKTIYEYPDRQYIGLQMKLVDPPKGGTTIVWLDRRLIFNEPHFIKELKKLSP